MSPTISSDLFRTSFRETPEVQQSQTTQNWGRNLLNGRVTSHSVLIYEDEPLDVKQDEGGGRSFIKIALLCFAVATAMGLIKYARSWIDPDEVLEPFNAASEAPLSNALSTVMEPLASVSQGMLSAALSRILEPAGRHLLATAGPTIQSYIGMQVLTEEVPFTFSWSLPNVFTTAGGAVSISAQQTNNRPLPQGVSIVDQPMQVISSFNLIGCKAVIYRDNYALVGTLTGLKIFDVSGSVPDLISSGDIIRIDTMVMDGNTCYALGSVTLNGGVSAWRITAIDVTDITNPSTLGSVTSTTSGIYQTQIFNDLFVLNGYCYVSGAVAPPAAVSTGVLFIFDVRNPSNFIQVNSISFPLVIGLDSAIVSSGLCYASSQGYLYAIDVQNPSSPSILGNLTLPLIQSLYPISIYDMKLADNYCYAATSDGLKIINVSDSSAISLIGTFGIGTVMHNVQLSGSSCFVTSTGPYIQNIDIRNPANPTLSAYMSTQGIAAGLAISPTNTLFVDSTGLSVGNLADTLVLKGTPAGGTQGNYSISLTAKDSNAMGVTQIFALHIQPAITVTGTFPNQKAVVGGNFNYIVQVFSQVNNAALSYTARLINSTLLPNWLSLSSATGLFSGTPSATDTGVLNLVIKAQDSLGSSASTTAQISVFYGPTLGFPISNQNVPLATVGNFFQYTVPDRTFLSNDGSPLTYSATQGGLDLPDWLTFNSTSKTFSGIPAVTNQGSIPVLLSAHDLTGISITTSFTIYVDIETPPVVGASLINPTVRIGSNLLYAIPQDTFTSPYASKITYSAISSDGTPLPNWLSFNPATGVFSGTPGRSDMEFYADGLVSISLTGTGIKASQTTHFNITIQGLSYGQILVAIAAPLASVFVGILGVPELCVLGWNRFFKERFKQQNQNAYIGKEYKSAPISIPWQEIKKFTTLVNGHAIAGGELPSWLEYDPEENIIKSRAVVPNINVVKTYNIQIFRRCGKFLKHTGRIMEVHTIQIKKIDEAFLSIEMETLKNSGDVLIGQRGRAELLALEGVESPSGRVMEVHTIQIKKIDEDFSSIEMKTLENSGDVVIGQGGRAELLDVEEVGSPSS
jgi:hypothetical protein